MKTNSLKWVNLVTSVWCLVIGIFNLVQIAGPTEVSVPILALTGLLFFVAGFNFDNFLRLRTEQKVREDIYRMMKEEADIIQQEILNAIEDEKISTVSYN